MDKKKLEFVIFCIENVADSIGKNPAEIYEIIANKTNILSNYIIPCFDVLHSQSKEYIVDDLTKLIKSKGAIIWFFIMDQI